jgi:hypothetical protein
MALNPRLRAAIIPALICIPLLTVITYFCFFTEQEPLTADEILEKKDWDKKELTAALSRAFMPQSNRRKREQVLNHLKKYLKKYPKDQQEAVRVQALKGAIHESIKQMRALPQQDRKQLISAMQKRARKTYEKINKMSKKNKDKIRSRLHSAEGKAVTSEVSRVMTSELTADERRDLAPVSKFWVKTLKEL